MLNNNAAKWPTSEFYNMFTNVFTGIFTGYNSFSIDIKERETTIEITAVPCSEHGNTREYVKHGYVLTLDKGKYFVDYYGIKEYATFVKL